MTNPITPLDAEATWGDLTPYECDLDGCYNTPVAWAKLGDDVPELWDEDGPRASIAVFCSLEHARAYPTATLGAAIEAMDIVMSAGASAAVWLKLIADYPEPAEFPRLSGISAKRANMAIAVWQPTNG